MSVLPLRSIFSALVVVDRSTSDPRKGGRLFLKNDVHSRQARAAAAARRRGRPPHAQPVRGGREQPEGGRAVRRDRLVVVQHQHREAHQAPRQRQRRRHPRARAGPGEPAQGQAWSKGEAALRGLAVLAISVVLTLYGLFRRLRRQSVLVVPVLALGATAAALALEGRARDLT